jgi:hypothetical protein
MLRIPRAKEGRGSRRHRKFLENAIKVETSRTEGIKLETSGSEGRLCALVALLQFVDPSAAEGRVRPRALLGFSLFVSINGHHPDAG